MKKQPEVLAPQTADDLIINKVHFENEYLEDAINKLLKTASWAMFKMNADEKEIHKHIHTIMTDISLKYSTKAPISFNVGDVVDCIYGTHLRGEINGNHVPSIVCDISNSGMAYVVPITGTNIPSSFTQCFNVSDDVIYENKNESRNIVLLDKGRYVSAKRFNSVIGKTSPAFFEKILKLLPLTFDFTNCLQNNSVSTEKPD